MTMKSSLMTLTIVTMLALCSRSSAEDTPSAKDVEELRREVRALEERLRALSAAATEVAELSMRSAAIWSRALGGEPRALEEAAAKAPAKPKPRTAPAPPQAPRAVGTVRGKVNIPQGEPIAYVYVENVFAPPVRGKSVVIDQ